MSVNLTNPSEGDVNWASIVNNNFDLIESALNASRMSRRAWLYRSTALNIPSNTATTIPMNAVDSDPSSGSNGTGYVVPVTGLWSIVSRASYAASGNTGSLETRLVSDVSGQIGKLYVDILNTGAAADQEVCWVGRLAAGEIITLVGFQIGAGGAARAINTGKDKTCVMLACLELE